MLLEASGTVVTMAMTGPIDVQRAALNYVSTLCQDKEFKSVPNSQLLDLLLSAFLSSPQDSDTLMQIKVRTYVRSECTFVYNLLHTSTHNNSDSLPISRLSL